MNAWSYFAIGFWTTVGVLGGLCFFGLLTLLLVLATNAVWNWVLER